MHLILASTSPNRKELFDRMGIAYQALAPDYEEIIDPQAAPFAQVQDFALGKAESVKDRLIGTSEDRNDGVKPNPLAIDYRLPTTDYLVMGFDSMIEFKGGSLGKAHSRTQAQAMLESFVGQPQQIVSGFALLGRYQGQDFAFTDYQATRVKFREDVSSSEINHYLDFNDWQGKCGAYSILGPGIFFLETLDGDFQNIVGVPVIKIGQIIKKELGVSWLELLEPRQR